MRSLNSQSQMVTILNEGLRKTKFAMSSASLAPVVFMQSKCVLLWTEWTADSGYGQYRSNNRGLN